MMISRQDGYSASYLQEVSTPNLYINNAFRATNLDVIVTLKEAKKLVKEREQCQKLGIAHKADQPPYFPISASSTVEDIRIAVDQKLSNPFYRIIEELFWFWPEPNRDIADDEALSYLRASNTDGAKNQWLASLGSRPEDIVPLHNLAVLHHLQALEVEQYFRIGVCFNLRCPSCGEYFWVTAKNSTAVISCPNCQGLLRTPDPSMSDTPNEEYIARLWGDAYDYWSRVWMSAQFWTELSLRARDIDENVGTETIDQIRRGFPEALLSINARLAIDYCSENNVSHATRQAQILFSSNFGEKHRLSSVRYATSVLIDQVHQQAKLTETKASARPESGLEEAKNLLDQTRSNIKCFEILNCSSLNLGSAACDAVAETALGALISYGNATRDCQSLIAPAQEILEIARSNSIKERISNNLSIFVSNAHQSIIDENIKPVTTLCESISLAIRSIGKNEKGRAFSLCMKFHNEVMPRLNEAKSRFGQISEEYKYASNVCAWCIREIAIALHNIDQNMQIALESIQWSKSLCRDPELRELLLKDLKVCQQAVAIEQEIKRRKARERLKPLWWIAGIAGLILFSVIKGCEDNNSSSSGTYSPPPIPSSNYNPSTLPSDGASIKPNSWTSQLSDGTSDTQEVLLQEIKDGKARLKRMESQLEEIKNNLDNYNRQLNYYKQLEDADNYNRLVPIFNGLVEKGKQLSNEYNSLFDEVNAKVDRYNKSLY